MMDLVVGVFGVALAYHVGRWNEEIRMARWRLMECRRLDQVIKGLRDATDDEMRQIATHITVAHAILKRSLDYPSDDLASRWREWRARRQAIREVTR